MSLRRPSSATTHVSPAGETMSFNYFMDVGRLRRAESTFYCRLSLKRARSASTSIVRSMYGNELRLWRLLKIFARTFQALLWMHDVKHNATLYFSFRELLRLWSSC
ncbi:hypothetical protein M413DRAFT_20993 [Hebeloma cylindrosporum]|uniref:Uncharacterized protein n=1 Tax=Hebeloma cylindrosporum TaxID=76867 RepID=A0A0C2YG12_HEBCY|nr:hypothetical protein M413DRAFT_20993 [Hebeloma cylindrosporum h7]